MKTPPSRPTAHHIALKVRRLDLAEGFYAGLLGLEVIRRWEDAEGQPRSVWLDLGGVILMLERSEVARSGLETSDPGPGPVSQDTAFSADPPGWHLLALRITPATRDAWRGHLESSGVPVILESAFTLYVRDPDGNRVGLSHFPDPAPAAGTG